LGIGCRDARTSRPNVNAFLVDITCDSDGNISNFIDLQDTRDYQALIDAATCKGMVKPREGVRLLEFYERQMLNKTYLNIELTSPRKKKKP